MKGEIIKYNENQMLIVAPFDPVIVKQRINQVDVVLNDGRKLSQDQRKKAYALLSDIANYNGDDAGYLHQIFKQKLCRRLDIEEFSLSNCSMTIAREYINMLIDFVLEHGIPSYDTYLTRTDDVDHFLWACLYYKKCCICGKEAEYHHATGSRVGMGRNRNEVPLLNTKGFALCRYHHTEAHQDEVKFCDKHHVNAMKIDTQILDQWNKKQ